MKSYRQFAPTACDSRGLGLPDRQDWLVGPCSRTRDSGPLEESNFASLLDRLGGEGDNVEVHRFGHWGPGWFEIVLISPDSDERIAAEDCEASLSDYPVLDDEDFCEREEGAALETWRNCYRTRDRIEWIRDNFRSLNFDTMADLMSAVRGKWFPGEASEMVQS